MEGYISGFKMHSSHSRHREIRWTALQYQFTDTRQVYQKGYTRYVLLDITRRFFLVIQRLRRSIQATLKHTHHL